MRARTLALLASLAAVVLALRRRAREAPEPPAHPPAPGAVPSGPEVTPAEPVAHEPPGAEAAAPVVTEAATGEAPEPEVEPVPAPPPVEAPPLARPAAAPLVAAPPREAPPPEAAEPVAAPAGWEVVPGPALGDSREGAPSVETAADEAPPVVESADLAAEPAPEPVPEPEEVPTGWEVVVPPPRRPSVSLPLRGTSEIRRFFLTNDVPVWFVSATAFGLLGVDRWVRRLTFVNSVDSFDGQHPNVLVPRHLEPRAFDSVEAVDAYLLSHEEVVDRIHADGGGKALFLGLDEEVERLARAAGLEIAFSSAALRRRLDSRIEATRLANEARVPSVPNVLGRARSYEGLVSLARGADLGEDLVVQTPYGDSGRATFFIDSRAAWDEHQERLVDEQLKVMRRIGCREVAVEGVVTRHGTLVGPLPTELTGHPELTPYGGGWCGSDARATVLTESQHDRAREYAQRMGERLRQEGYRGAFGLDVLVDVDSGELYLGRLAPGLPGPASMTSVAAVARGEMPLLLFHLLEFMDVDYELDVPGLNEAWATPGAAGEWSQFVFKDTADEVALIADAPPSGIWRLDPAGHGGIRHLRPETDWRSVASEDEAFFLRIAQPGGYSYPGAGLGVLVTRGRLQGDDHELTERARAWISGIRAQLRTVAPPGGEPAPVWPPEPFTSTIL